MKIVYFTEVGSYRGCVKIMNRWMAVKNLDYIDKTGWERHQGPPTVNMVKEMTYPPIDARSSKELKAFCAKK